MKQLASLLLLTAFFSCSKKDALEQRSSSNYQIRIAAVEKNGGFSYSPTSQVKSGTVSVEFETTEVADISQYNVEVSTDGRNFKTVKTIAADPHQPNRLYTEQVVLP